MEMVESSEKKEEVPVVTVEVKTAKEITAEKPKIKIYKKPVARKKPIAKKPKIKARRKKAPKKIPAMKKPKVKAQRVPRPALLKEIEPSFYRNDERLVSLVEGIKKDLSNVLSEEIHKAGVVSREIPHLETQEKYMGAKKTFLEEAQVIRTLQRIQKEITLTLSELDDIRNENSEEILDFYYKKLGIEPNFNEEGAVSVLKNGEGAPPEKGGKAPENTESSTEKGGEDEEDMQADIADLEKLYKAGNIRAVLKKIIEIQSRHQKSIDQILSGPQKTDSTFNIPRLEGGSLALKIDRPAEPVQSESSIKNVEMEISLDIPSIRIKDKFAIQSEIGQKVEKIEQKKNPLDFLGLTKEPDEKEKLRRMVTESLKKASYLSDERKKVVAISYIIRQFLEVKFKISKSLTYSEIVSEIQSRDIDPYIKTNLVELFTRLPESIYRKGDIGLTSEYCMDLAQKTLLKLGGRDEIKKIGENPAQKAQPK